MNCNILKSIVDRLKKKIDKPIVLKIDNEKLEQKDYTKYLGVIIDENLILFLILIFNFNLILVLKIKTKLETAYQATKY